MMIETIASAFLYASMQWWQTQGDKMKLFHDSHTHFSSVIHGIDTGTGLLCCSSLVHLGGIYPYKRHFAAADVKI